MTERTHEAIEADLAAYVTGGLDPAAQAQVARHLRSCASCRQTLREYEAVLALVPLGLPEATPPPGAAERLLARARGQGGATLRRGGPGWPSAPRRLVGAVAAGLALVLALLGGVALQQRAAAPVAPRVVTLAGQEAAPSASGLLALSADGAELTVAGLPPLPPGRAYQLWFVRPDAARQSGGVFTVDPAGQGSLAVSVPGPLSAFVRVGITEEPAGGSPGPTGPALLVGEL